MVLKGASVLSILEMAAMATTHIGVISPLKFAFFYPLPFRTRIGFVSSEKLMIGKLSVRCSEKGDKTAQRTCKNCKNQFDPLVNHPRACRFHTAHFGGETKRKFESVYSGGTLDTPGSGKVLQYWHCCGSEDPFDPGCTASPHASYDD